MATARQVLFLQGGGAGTHDEWDDKLVDSSRLGLGDGCDVRYPRLPDEHDPSCDGWAPAPCRELVDLDDERSSSDHSVGGTMLMARLADEVAEAVGRAVGPAG